VQIYGFFRNSRPLQADFLEPKDEEDGLLEKMLQKTHQLVKYGTFSKFTISNERFKGNANSDPDLRQ
jgi:hypothetical protein